MAFVWLALVPSLRPFLACLIFFGLLRLEAQAHLLELVLHFLDGLGPEITDVEQVALGALGELADRVDALPLQTVVAAHGEVQLLDRRVEHALAPVSYTHLTLPTIYSV